MYISFRGSAQQHDMQAEQLVSHVIRFFFLSGEDGKHTTHCGAGNMSISAAGEWTDMTLYVIRLTSNK